MLTFIAGAAVGAIATAAVATIRPDYFARLKTWTAEKLGLR